MAIAKADVITFSCDHEGCRTDGAHWDETVEDAVLAMILDEGWTADDHGRVFCPKHSGKVEPTP